MTPQEEKWLEEYRRREAAETAKMQIPGTLDLGSVVRGMGNYPAFFGTGQQVYILGQPASDDDRHQRRHIHTGTYPQ